MTKPISNAYDVTIIGGGIHGAGVAQAAAAAGYSVLLLEQNEIGSATSSQSSKLIHGGLRYLESAQFSLVKECLQDRNQLLKLAPQLVKLVPFYIPVYKNSKRSALTIRAGLCLYALLGKLDYSVLFSKISLQKWDNTDNLSSKDLKCIFKYWDAQTDDKALTNAVVQSAKNLGAYILTAAKFTNAALHHDHCQLNFQYDNNSLTVKTRFLVNASGPWINETLRSITPTPDIMPIDLVQGTHILVDRNQSQSIYYLESSSDKRAIFSMPWKNKTLIGTTEKLYDGDPANTAPTEKEIDYLLSIYNHYFPASNVNRSDIITSFSGLRVLPKENESVFSRSRDICMVTYPQKNPIVLSIYGGKLTAFASTARKALKEMKKTLPVRKAIADVSRLSLT